MYPLPEKFVQTILSVHQEKGELWLKQFDDLLHYCEEKWRLRVQSHYSLSYNFVAPVVFSDGTEAVLKLGVPHKEIDTEIAALRHYRGRGTAVLIDSDEEKGILILERLSPGHSLKTINNDEEAARIAAKVIMQLAVPAPANPLFPTVARWAKGLERLREHYKGGTGPIPETMVRKAERLYDKLLSTSGELRLLHGDLHHDNILSASPDGKTWLAIDAKGVIGELEYEVISYLMNNQQADNIVDQTVRRVDIFTQELSLNKDRVMAWAFCHCILSTWWCIEDGVDGVERGIEKARVFESLLGQLH